MKLSPIGKSCGLILVLMLAGCADRTEPEPEAPPFIPVTVPLAPEIPPGERPASIGGFRYFALADFIKAKNEGEISSGDLLCIEGRVEKSGEIFGAFTVTLHIPGTDQGLCCDGDKLSNFGYDPDSNHLFKGKWGNDCLIHATLVTPEELAEALQKNDGMPAAQESRQGLENSDEQDGNQSVSE